MSAHAANKLAKELFRLGITEELLKDVVRRPDEVLYDSVTGRYVALKKNRSLVVVYELRERDIFIITAIYSSKLKETIEKRKRSGRWI